ncbi:alpha/beta hydrolase [Corallococcus praedator]|uniref:Alpha/beta hydrolase n=2 Tax=Corallococcus TaxID=83461 RepID=A0ABX9QHT7_9BACT|nr:MULTISPECIES: alpha/beta hydrolase [Corallococcus]RKH10934.1 alpha/beta hydrolase [Corallococcus sp. CA047B]RKH30122.1 alpha/beta hydrolase [Corallococcus sp. CA031C]RKI06578.1 alpha/beta hydrolase [Corallococcus praedator]
MRRAVELTDIGGGCEEGPRVLLLPGLGARGAGFRALAERLADVARPILVEYPEGEHAACGARALAEQVLRAAGSVDAVVASSFGGMVAAHLAAGGATRGVAFLGSFTRTAHVGPRGRLIAMMGPIAVLGRPGRVAASLAAWRPVPSAQVADVVPTTLLERLTTLRRAFAIHSEPPPPDLRASKVSCLCIQGDRDVLVPPATLARLVASLPDGTPRHLLRGAGHVPYFSHPEECARLLGPWLQTLVPMGLGAAAGADLGSAA